MANFFKILLSIFAKPKEAKSFGKISSDAVSELFADYISSDKIFLSDQIFDVTSVDEGQKFMSETLVSNEKYSLEGHDCDNFSFAAMGYWSQGLESFAFGIAWSNSHAFNIMIDDKSQIWICEPQNNYWYKIDDLKKLKLEKNYLPLRMVLI